MSQENQIPEVPDETDETIEEGTKRRIPIWADLDHKQKRIASITIISIVMVVCSLLAYHARQAAMPTAQDEIIEKKELSLNNGEFEKSLQNVLIEKDKQKDLEIEALKKRFEEIKASGGIDPNVVASAPVSTSLPDGVKGLDPSLLPEPPIAKAAPGINGMSLPLPPKTRGGGDMYRGGMDEFNKNAGMSAPLPSPSPSETPQPTLIGEIDSTPVEAKEDDKKKNQEDRKNTIYLPPSFVEATLLSGVTAKTSAQAKNDPSPLLFRIKDLAVLPNNVKANVKGCFVIAEGVGDLSDERVHTRLITLSCVAKNGESVIDQPIKGWAEDNADGKVGLRGEVVAKMGANIARSALAGFVGGFGEALSSSVTTTAMSANGIPTTAYTGSDTKDYVKAGSGAGIKNATEDIKKFYLDLAQQSIPVIEVLPSKVVTLVFSEGVNLEIKNVNMKGMRGIKK